MQVNYSRHAGVKFEKDGSLRRFPGNTVICMVDPDSATHRLLVWAHERLAAMKCIRSFSLLPPDSFHMTVMEGVCDQVRTPANWPSDVPLSATLDEVRAFFKERLSSLTPPTSFSMQFNKIDAGDVVKFDLLAADNDTGRLLAEYRDALAEATTLRFENHDRYVFHISLAYMIREPESSERSEVQDVVSLIESRVRREFGIWQSGPPVLCYFDDMFQFIPERVAD